MCVYFLLDSANELKKFTYPQTQSVELRVMIEELGLKNLNLQASREGELLEMHILIHPEDEIAFLPDVLIDPVSWRQGRLNRAK